MPDGILSGPLDLDGRRRAPVFPPVAAALGLVVGHRPSGVTGAVMEWRPSRVTLLDRNGRRHQFVNERGAFSVEGRPCTLVAPGRPRTQRRLTSSGSVAVEASVPRVARGGRIWVEGTNDAELVEHVWGDDLRVEGVVVEPMGGMDDLEAMVDSFGPGPDRPLGVLLDHLVAGSKEQRAAERLASNPNVAVTGHPFVDVWAAIDPSLAGLVAWPDVPRGLPWKETVARLCGFDRNDRFWTSLLRRVRTYADLDPTLVGAVERLIDFVTVPTGGVDVSGAIAGA
jgi:DUF3097, C-terminal domain/DUF3097, N-terminal domain